MIITIKLISISIISWSYCVVRTFKMYCVSKCRNHHPWPLGPGLTPTNGATSFGQVPDPVSSPGSQPMLSRNFGCLRFHCG